MNSFIISLKQFFSKILPGISLLLPAKRNLWIFGAWNGEQYSDNSKYMFEYVNKNHPEINAVWITRSKSVFKTLREAGRKCALRSSFRGIFYSIFAEVAFETEGNQDISPLLNNKKTVTVQLWHGMGFKSMNWNGGMAKKREKFAKFHWIATSDLYIETFTKLMQIPAELFSITGYPRDDSFVLKPQNTYMESLLREHADKKFIIYMPTHRNFGKDGNNSINIDAFRKIDSELIDHNIIMVYKPHFHELNNFLRYEDEFTNIILAKDKSVWDDVYGYLHYFDLLISDYSSVITDFMCSGKPVVYFPYDIKDYETADAGLNDYFFEIPGGPMCYTWDEVIDQTVALLENDTWKEERERCFKFYHQFNDGNNCKRVFDETMKLIGRESK
jgi:CDP-glycerol glycerophosphotransferase (TagB/SpsB family)